MTNYSAYLNNESDLHTLKATYAPLVLNSCGYQYFHHTPFTIDRPHGRMDYHLIYIAKGTGYFYVEGSKRLLSAGHLILYKPNDKQWYSYNNSKDTHIYWFHLTGSQIEAYLQSFQLLDASLLYFENSSELISIHHNLIYEAHRQFLHYDAIIHGLLLQLLALISRKAYFTHLGLTTHFSKEIQLTVQFIQEHYTEKLSITMLAKLANLSRSRFIHKFKEMMGITPIDYAIMLRLNKACELLVGTCQPIQMISQQVGYDDALYFSKLFKKSKGISPSTYRKINLGNE